MTKGDKFIVGGILSLCVSVICFFTGFTEKNLEDRLQEQVDLCNKKVDVEIASLNAQIELHRKAILELHREDVYVDSIVHPG